MSGTPEDNSLLTDEEIRKIVNRWFPISPESLNFAYNGDIREVARDFGFHIAAAQLSKVRQQGK